jgi:hypothetical protein
MIGIQNKPFLVADGPAKPAPKPKPSAPKPTPTPTPTPTTDPTPPARGDGRRE